MDSITTPSSTPQWAASPLCLPYIYPVFSRILDHCEYSTLLSLRETSRLAQQEVDRFITITSKNELVICMPVETEDTEVYTTTNLPDWSPLRGKILPWFHLDSPPKPKIATLNKCRKMKLLTGMLNMAESLLEHLPRTCRLRVIILYTPVAQLPVHSVQCVVLVLKGITMYEEEDWWSLHRFAGPNTQCLHIEGACDTGFDSSDLGDFPASANGQYDREPRADLRVILALRAGLRHTWQKVRTRRVWQKVFLGSEVVEADEDGDSGGRFCSLPEEPQRGS